MKRRERTRATRGRQRTPALHETGARSLHGWVRAMAMIAPDEYDVFPAAFDVSVIGNRIASGELPAADPALGIAVRDNVRE